MPPKDHQDLPPLPSNSSQGHWLANKLRRFKILPPASLGLFAVMIRGMVLALGLSLLVGGFGLFVYLQDLGLFQIEKEQFAPILHWKPADNTLVYNRKQEKIGELFNSYHIFVPYERLPKPLIDAILAIEDRNFWTHRGIDPKAILRAIMVYLMQKESRFSQGASTITQQLVRYFLLPREKTISRKIREMLLAIELEKHFSKTKILEIYANSLFLGHGAYGVGAAAQRYFHKDLSRLETHELAVIAGLFQSPSGYNPHRFPKRAKERQSLVLTAMANCGFLSQEQAKQWAAKPLHYQTYTPWYGRKAPYFIDFIHEQAKALLDYSSIKNKGLRIYTSLDPELQALAEEAISSSKALLEEAEQEMQAPAGGSGKDPTGPSRRHLEAALLVTDPRNGHILAMVGGRDYEQSQFNRTYQARRQPGSAFKPIVYSLALEQDFRWSDVLYVAPITLAGSYRPRTPTNEYMTQTTLLRAFYRSMNAPTMELGEKLGLAPVIAHARKLGVETAIKQEFGTMLGASEVSMMDLARVNGAIANRGRLVALTGIETIKDREGKILYQSPPPEERSSQALSPQVAFLIEQGMRQVLANGTGRQFSELASWAAGKTGTSNDAKDNWFTGFTSELTAITWVGSDESVPLYGNAQGGTLALPIWAKFIKAAQNQRPSKHRAPPSGVVAYRVNPHLGYLASDGVLMWFLNHLPPRSGHSPQEVFSHRGSFRNPMIP